MHKIPKIALLVSTERRFGRDLLAGIAKYAKIHGPWVFYREPPDYMCIDSKKRLARLKEWGPDGIIARETIIIDKIISLNIPTIAAPYGEKLIPGVPNIITKGTETGKMAAEHLLDCGFCRFAYFGAGGMGWSIKRKRGFSKRLKEAGFNVHSLTPKSIAQLPWEKQQNTLAKWLESLPKPIGIMACAGEFALNILEACKVMDLCIPEEVAVITTDNDELIYDLSFPPLSSVVYNTPKSGYEAAEVLERMMQGKKITNKIIYVEPVHVARRQSTDILAIDDQIVAKAISFIRRNSKYSINVNDVVNYVKLSRPELGKRFKSSIGHTVLAEITRFRTNEIINMLLKTDLSVSQIALRLGFPDDKHISRYFRKQTGLTPKAYQAKFGKKI
ncbi:MAG: DNA-binding transcriptional regulator [Planctomycetota bacterium]|jgi:LacI family transcriptional regulator